MNVLQSSNPSALQKYVVKILTNMFADMPKYSSKCIPNILYPVWMLFNKSIALYLAENVVKIPKSVVAGLTN